jgi:HEAT repeat protein
MVDKIQLKSEGLVFGRNLQKALKVTSMYGSIGHSAADLAAQQTYVSLNPLLKQAREFTLGFMNQRLQLNNVLTRENPLTGLEAEFTKRGITAVTFEAGITPQDFKRGLELLATSPKSLEKGGGIKRLLEQSPLQHIRIIATPKAREDEDTVLPMGSESYMLAQAILEPQAGKEGSSLDLIFQSAGVGMPAGFGGSASEIRELAGKAVGRVLEEPDRDLQETVTILIRLFEQLTPDYLLASLTPAKQSELRGHPAQDLVADLVEDVTVESAGKRLAAAPPGAVAPDVLEDVMRVLVRGLKATRLAERLLQKLARFIEEAKLPSEVLDRIREELAWLSLPEPEKHAQLLRLERFDDREFRRLVNYVHDRMREGRADLAVEVSHHYLGCMEKAPADVAVEQLRRAPELLRALAGPGTAEFLSSVAGRLCPELLKEERRGREFHQQAANCLASVAQNAVLCGDFKLVQRIGASLLSSAGKNAAQHADCCGRALQNLVTPSTADRVVELYLENRDDPAWTKTAASLLRVAGGVGPERALERLAGEPVASNRLRLLRLIEQLGAPAIEVARKGLADDRWYVVRNACYLLGHLGDPDLSNQLRAALRHPEPRVQQAAVTAIIKSQFPNRAAALAEALPDLKGEMQEITLDELAFLKDPAVIESLEKFLLQKKVSRADALEKAVRVLAAIPSDRAVEVLGGVLADTEQAQSVRRVALAALKSSSSPHANRLMLKFSRLDPKDELVRECQTLLGISPP